MVSVAMSLLVTIIVKTLPRRKLREKEVES
jgi:hypothetical protein